MSLPPELDDEIEVAADAAGLSYSAWIAQAVRKELSHEDRLRAGLEAVREYEREFGAFTEEELAEADAWAQAALERSKQSGNVAAPQCAAENRSYANGSRAGRRADLARRRAPGAAAARLHGRAA